MLGVFDFFFSQTVVVVNRKKQNKRKGLKKIAEGNRNANQKVFEVVAGLSSLAPKRNISDPIPNSSAKHRQARLPLPDATSSSSFHPTPSTANLPLHHQALEGNN